MSRKRPKTITKPALARQFGSGRTRRMVSIGSVAAKIVRRLKVKGATTEQSAERVPADIAGRDIEG